MRVSVLPLYKRINKGIIYIPMKTLALFSDPKLHDHSPDIPLDESTFKRLHAMARGQIWDAGKYKEKDGDIIERHANGQEGIRFRPTPATETSAAMEKLIETWNQSLQERWTPPAVALAAFNLDFLCIHPFRDGNGRVSRLTLLLQSYHAGMAVGRYISLERLIEQNNGRGTAARWKRTES